MYLLGLVISFTIKALPDINREVHWINHKKLMIMLKFDSLNHRHYFISDNFFHRIHTDAHIITRSLPCGFSANQALTAPAKAILILWQRSLL